MAKNTVYKLPQDVMESQLSMVDLLTAMFPSPGELEISSQTQQHIENLQRRLSNETSEPSVPTELSFAIILSIDPEHSIRMDVTVPLQSSEQDPIEPPPITFSVRQPAWMARPDYTEFCAQLPEDIFSAIDEMRDSGGRYTSSASQAQNLARAEETKGGADSAAKDASTASSPLVRVWFYFPSLSTRSKRSDLVSYAPSHGLTGFVLAGKPGVLCLEGASEDVDAYMKFIKSVSWSDIPSHQKKVTERFREVGSGDGGRVERVFEGMSEITDVLGERRGERANRGDMKALEGWLRGKGLGEAFERVILQ